MDATQLAKAMLEYQELAAKLAMLGDAIKDAVMIAGKTQTVGSLTASYSGGRKSYDYQTAWTELGGNTELSIDAYTTSKVVTTIDYRSACIDGKIEAPFVQSDPSVTLKLA